MAKNTDKTTDAAGVKPGSRPTFTSLRGATTFAFQKPQRDRVKGIIVTDGVTVTIQRGVEFNVFRECEKNPTFKKLVKDGILREGVRVPFTPEDLQEFLESKIDTDTNRIILWKNRPRSAREIELEQALASKESVIEAGKLENAKLVALLQSNNIEIPKE